MSTRAGRRARAALETALGELEVAAVLGRPPAAAHAALAAALAQPELDEDERGAARARAARVAGAAVDPVERARYAAAHGIGGVVQFRSDRGARITRVVTESFPRHVNYVYLLEVDEHTVLFDCGSGAPRARQMVLDGLEVARLVYGARARPEDITAIFISHGHFDHFGDARFWKDRTHAPVWIHELDARVLENFQERAVMSGRDIAVFLRSAGLGVEHVQELLRMYLEGKERYAPVAVDRRLQHRNELLGGRARVIHTPGHCPGHVCLRVDDVLLVSDQVLSPISPHLSPQQLNPHNGLERYLFGLARLGKETDVGLVLPAHYEPIPDLHRRMMAIADEHVEKLHSTVDACRAGATVQDVAAALFGAQEGYNVLLALLEAGTHVEYLHQLGSLVVKNVDVLAERPDEPVVYQSTAVWSEPPLHSFEGDAVLGGG